MVEKVRDGRVSWKKWSLLLFCVIGIMSTLILSSVAIIIVDSIADLDDTAARPMIESTEAAKNSAKIMIGSSAIIAILIDLMAYFGGHRDRYVMTLTYIMFMVMIATGSILIGVRTQCWYPTILHFFIIGLAYDLRIIRDRAFRPNSKEAQCCSGHEQSLNVVSCQTYAPHTACPHMALEIPDFEFKEKQPILPTYKESKKLPEMINFAMKNVLPINKNK